MAREVGVHIDVSPPLLAELVQRAVLGDGVTLTDRDCQVSIVTPENVGGSLSRIVIVLGDSVEGDVRVIIDGSDTEARAITAQHLHDLVLELADGVGTNLT